MEETKIIGQLGAFGILGLIICLFIACTICLCVTVHVRFIYTYLCPIKNLQTCCRLFSQKFRASHKQIPDSIHELEQQISGSRRAQKIARKVNQSETLRDFHSITPRLNSFIVDLQQEEIISRRVVYNRSSDQILLPRVFAAEPEERLPSHLVNARLNLHRGSKIATSFEHTPKNSVVDLLAPPYAKSANNQKTELSQSLFDSSISATAHNAQVESLKPANDIEQRTRASSVDQISRVPHPQIKFVKESLNTFQDY